MSQTSWWRIRGHWLWLVPWFLLASAAFTRGQSSFFVHRTFVTPDPNPLFPWDTQGQRVMGHPDYTVQWALDLNSDGQPEYRFVSEGGGFGVVPEGQNAVLAYAFGPGGMNGWAVPLPSLAPVTSDPGQYSWFRRIDTSLGPIGAGFVAGNSEGDIGTFLGIESAYVGIQFSLADGTHYGWIRLGCPAVGLPGGWIYETAYDIRPDTPILTGVPEPSVVSLLVGGAFVLWLWRRIKGTG